MGFAEATGETPEGHGTQEPPRVPRRFGVGTLLIIVVVYAGLFGLLRILDADPVLFGMAAVLLIGAGAGQVFLFRGTRPREASCLVGACLCPLMMLAVFLGDHCLGLSHLNPAHSIVETSPQLLSSLVYVAIAGAGLGWSAGSLTAGVFLLMDRIERGGADVSPRVDGAPSGTTKRIAGDETLTPGESSLWHMIRRNIPSCTPFRARRPLGEAMGIFVVTAVLVGLASPFLPWTWWKHVLGAILTGLLLAFFSTGVRRCGWRGVLTFFVIGVVGALVPGVILCRIYLWPGSLSLRLTSPPDEIISFGLTVIVGSLLGLFAAASLGWLRWVLNADNAKEHHGRTTMLLGITVALSLALLYGGASVWLLRVSQQPGQQALARIDELGGFVGKTPMSWGGGMVDTVQLIHTAIDDADLQRLSVFRNLRFLSLYGSKVSDTALIHLAPLAKLKKLDLRDTGISDTGVVHLKGLPSLESLNLSGTRITDGGLQHLKDLARLRYLGLERTQVTDHGIEDFRRTSPNCRISHESP